jgi:hypothetical protein
MVGSSGSSIKVHNSTITRDESEARLVCDSCITQNFAVYAKITVFVSYFFGLHLLCNKEKYISTLKMDNCMLRMSQTHAYS